VIFGIKVEGSLKHGFTFQFDSRSHSLLQAEGFCRASVTDEMKSIATACFDALTSGEDMPQITDFERQ
jgi:hypothetical protein